MDYLKYEFPVLDTLGQAATLEISADPTESSCVGLSATLSRRYDSVSLEPDAALQMADALDQRIPVEVPASDDYDDGATEVHVSWDEEGADILLYFQTDPTRVVIGYDVQPDQIAHALRECVSYLNAAFSA